MYTPKHFEERSTAVMYEHIRKHPLATVVTHSEGGLNANHIPLLLSTPKEKPPMLYGHIARGNPLWKQVPNGASVLAVFLGPQHYITPNWYASKKSHGKTVPTWNYSAVHVSGIIRWTIEPARLREIVTELTDTHEANSSQPWRVSDAPPEYISAMLEAIVGLEIEMHSIEGKWKVSQNRTPDDIKGVIEGLEQLGTESSKDMSQLVRLRMPPS